MKGRIETVLQANINLIKDSLREATHRLEEARDDLDWFRWNLQCYIDRFSDVEEQRKELDSLFGPDRKPVAIYTLIVKLLGIQRELGVKIDEAENRGSELEREIEGLLESISCFEQILKKEGFDRGL